MKHTLALTLSVAMLAAACGSSTPDSADTSPAVTVAATDPPVTEPSATVPPVSEPTETTPPATDPAPTPDVEVFSDDGEVGARVGGDEAVSDVSIRLLDSSEWPDEVAGGDNVPGVKIYELEPDGATFEEPVVVTRRLDISAFDSLGLGPRDVPLVTMLTQNDDGTFEMLDDLSLLRVGDSLFVSASTTHFSPIIISNENRMLPYLPGEGPDGPPPVDPGVEFWFEGEDRETEDYSDVIRQTMGEGPEVIQVERWLTAEEASAYLRQLIEDQMRGEPDSPDAEPTHIPFVPVIEGGELDPEIEALLGGEPLGPMPAPGPTAEEAGARAQRTGSYQPFVPISLAPSAAVFLGSDLGTFELTVAVIDLLIPSEELDRIIESILEEYGPILGPPGSFEFAVEVFHRAFGVYPSSVAKIYRGLRFEDEEFAYSTLWTDDPRNGGQLVSIGELFLEGDDYVGETGIDCFCRFVEALIIAKERLDADFLTSANGEELRKRIAADPSGIGLFVVAPEGTTEAHQIEVGSAEGSLGALVAVALAAIME